MRKKRRPARHHSLHLTYRLLVILAGGIFFVWSILLESGSVNWGISLLLAFFIFIQLIFGLPILTVEADLTHAVSLGGGLLFGGPTAVVGVAGGFLFGSAARAFAARKTENGSRTEKPDYLNWLSEAGVQIIALVTAWWAMGLGTVPCNRWKYILTPLKRRPFTPATTLLAWLRPLRRRGSRPKQDRCPAASIDPVVSRAFLEPAARQRSMYLSKR